MQTSGTIVGTVLSRNGGEALAGANVIVLGTARGAVGDENGVFEIRNLLPGKYSVEVRMMGYKSRIFPDVSVVAGLKTRLEMVLEQTAIPLSEVVVTPGQFKISEEAKGSERVLGIREVFDTPGSAGDIIWVTQAMPGVVSSGETGPIYVRGGNPDENLVLYDNAPISSAFYIEPAGGGLFSVFRPDMLREVSLLTGGFPAEYGDRLSAVLDVRTRDGSREEFKGLGSLSMAGVELRGEGPITAKGSYMASVRRSYFDLVMKMVGDTEGMVSYPNYADFQGKFSYSFTPSQRWSFTALRGQDWMIFNIDDPDFQGDFKWQSRKEVYSVVGHSFFGKDWMLQTTLSSSDNSRLIRMGNRWQVDEAEKDRGWKEELNYTPSSRQEWKAGFWLAPLDYRNRYNLPVDRDTTWGSATVGERWIQTHPSSYKDALYLEDKFRLSGSLTSLVGLRYDYFRMNRESRVSPRISLAFSPSSRTTLTAAWGLFSQFPRPFYLDPREGNPGLQASRAVHYVLGLETDLGPGLKGKVECYEKDVSHLVTHDSLNQYRSDGHGFARGVEVLVQRPEGRFSGWLSYGLAVSKRKEGDAPGLIYHDYDVRHVLTLVGNWKLGETLQLGAKWRYSSGRPLTPLEGAWADTSAFGVKWHPVWGEENSERYPPYHRLDLRLLHKHTIKGYPTTSFIELFNSYNRKNVLEYQYNWDYSERKSISFFQFMPVGGIMVDF